MLVKIHEFINTLSQKVVGNPTIYFTANTDALAITFLWPGGLHYKRMLSIYDIVQSNLTDIQYGKRIIEKANAEYEKALAEIISAPEPTEPPVV